MKTILQIICLLFSISSIAQNLLFVNFESSESINSDFHLYTNDSLIYKYCESQNKEDNQLNNLEIGEYKILFNSINGIDSLNVSFSANKDFQIIELFTERIDFEKVKKTESVIEGLKNDEKLTLLYSNINCYTPKELKLTIVKKNGIYYELKNNKQKRIKNRVLTFLINYEKIIRTGRFENDLHPELVTISTASINYELVKNNNTIYCRRISSNWKGIYEIENYLW
ncbi:MAG: hypothetical protein LBE34_02940 [Flavobacteriaceae bacterium]|jgi:hypothetical protein|nr:hypothetical protein [Flavobacteriaceae bacterium]